MALRGGGADGLGRGPRPLRFGLPDRPGPAPRGGRGGRGRGMVSLLRPRGGAQDRRLLGAHRPCRGPGGDRHGGALPPAPHPRGVGGQRGGGRPDVHDLRGGGAGRDAPGGSARGPAAAGAPPRHLDGSARARRRPATQVAQYIVLIIAYLLPVFWISNNIGAGFFPHFMLADEVARIGELEQQFGFIKNSAADLATVPKGLAGIKNIS